MALQLTVQQVADQLIRLRILESKGVNVDKETEQYKKELEKALERRKS